MSINSDKPHLWKADIALSVDYYNEWFLKYAPSVFKEQRVLQSKIVIKALKETNYLLKGTSKNYIKTTKS